MVEELYNNPDVSDGQPPVALRPTLARSPKKVQFPTLQEIENNNIAPPGSTPITSATNITASISTTANKSRRITPTTKLLHSSTSLEVEVESVCTGTSPCASATNSDATSVSTFLITSHDEQPQHYSVYQQPRLPPPRRGSSVPAQRTVSTEPVVHLTIANPQTAVSTPGGIAGPRYFPNLPSKSILRKPLLVLKDANSNAANERSTQSSGSVMSSVPAPYRSEDDNDGTGAIKSEMWENIGKTSVPIAAPVSARMSRREYRTPRTRSTLSSSGSSYGGSDMGSGGSKSLSLDVLPPIMTTSRGGRSVKKQLHNLTSVLSELKEKEVVFDRTTAIQALKARILRGERVTHEEIKAVRRMTLPPHQRHLGYRLPWSKDLYCVKGLVHIPTPNKPAPGKNTFGTVEDLRVPFDDQITMEHYGRRQYVLNLAGFEENDISLYLEGKNRLVLRAERFDGVETKKYPITVTETILLPPDLPADNLRIVRKPSGTTIIEESWRF